MINRRSRRENIMKKEVTNKILWIFAIGQLGWSMLAGVITNWFVYYYAPEQTTLDLGHKLFVPAGVVLLGMTIIGIISALGRIFDAVTDPYVASKSDALKHKLGRRIPFMRWAAIPFGVVCFLIFLTPLQEASSMNAVYIGVGYILFYLFMTMYCTPYNALIPVLGRTQENRTKISTFISFTFIIGSTLSFALPNIAGVFSSLGYVNSFRVAVLIIVVISVICMLIPAFLIHEKDYDDAEPVKTNAFSSLAKTFQNKNFRVFVGSDVLYFTALTLFNTGMPFYVTSLIGLEESMTFILIAVMTACSLLFYPLIGKVLKKFGKKKMVMFAFIFFSGTFLFTAFSGKIGLPPMVNGIAIAVLASLPMAILGIIPNTMIADIAECDAIETKENREGMFYAARTFSFKMGQSVSMILFTSVKLIGAETFLGLRLTVVIAFVLCLLGAIIFTRYNEKNIYQKLGVKN